MKLYKYYSLATKEHMAYAAQAIIKRELYCGDPITFNDPFDCNIATHLNPCLKKLGVACLSGDRADHVLMFSHYADRHKGIALVFDIVEDATIGDSTFLGLGQWVDYVDHERLPDLASCHDCSRAREAVFTKWKKWEYENEYRVLADLEECDPSPVRKFEQDELVGVIFGLHTPACDHREVDCWLSQANYKTVWRKKAMLADTSFSLEFKFL
ncbi:DUF2971 domain-containing protein [Kiritimatiellota bacterium B12222]|nr:DUF2971 domain-containing protein [Kiritimatiellota bacterium B12222]